MKINTKILCTAIAVAGIVTYTLNNGRNKVYNEQRAYQTEMQRKLPNDEYIKITETMTQRGDRIDEWRDLYRKFKLEEQYKKGLNDGKKFVRDSIKHAQDSISAMNVGKIAKRIK